MIVNGFDEVVPPGQEGQITLSLNAIKYTGLVGKEMEFTTNDPQRPRFTLALRLFIIVPGPHPGRRFGPFVFSPSPRWVTRLVRGSAAQTSITIYNDGPQPVRIIKLTAGGEVFSLQLDALQEGRLYQLTVKSAPSLPLGRYVQAVKLATESGEVPELELKLEATVVPPILATPEALSFDHVPISSANDDVSRMTKLVSIQHARRARFEIKQVSATLPFLKLEVAAENSGETYLLKVGIDKEKLTKGDYKGIIKIETNNPEVPVLEIPVTLTAQ